MTKEDLQRVLHHEFLIITKEVPLDCAEPQSGEETLRCLSDSDLERLCPDGQFSLALLPLRPLVSNLKMVIEEHHPIIIASWDCSKITALSCGIPHKTISGIRYNLDFYGESENILQVHVIRHLMVYSKKVPLDNQLISLWVRYPFGEHFSSEKMESFLHNKLALGPTGGTRSKSNIALIEIPLPQ